MKRLSAIVLAHDYWHPQHTIEPLIPMMFPVEEWNVEFTDDPNELLEAETTPDLLVSFKDPVENDQIPTPVWCSAEWTGKFMSNVRAGMGFLAVHCGLTDLPREHVLTKEIIRGFFVNHPPQCEVKFIPEKEHPILEGVSEFVFPSADEHYVMDIDPSADTEILAYTESEHGRQPALWAHTYGEGRICCVTPGHDTPNLVCHDYLKVLRNAVRWCIKQDD